MNKMEMSLDDIIKSAKAHAKEQKRPKKGGKAKINSSKSPTKGGGVAKRRPTGQKKETPQKQQNVRKPKRGQVKVGLGKAKGVKRVGGQKKTGKKVTTPVATTAATKKLVQKLVKKAIAKTKVGRTAALRAPVKGIRRRLSAGRRRPNISVEGRGVMRGRIGKRNIIVEQRPRIVALPPVQPAQFARAPVAYQVVPPAIARRNNQGRQRSQLYTTAPTQQFLGGGVGGSIRAQIAAMQRQQQSRVVYVQRPAQPQYIIQQPQRVVTTAYQRLRPQQQFARRQGQRRAVKSRGIFQDPPNFLQRI